MGDHQRAINNVKFALGGDNELAFDAYKLQGICYYRLGNIPESIRCYNQANRIRLDICKAGTHDIEIIENKKDLETTYINLFIEETRLVFEDPKFIKQVMRVSKSVPNLYGFILKDVSNFRRITSEKDLLSKKKVLPKVKATVSPPSVKSPVKIANTKLKLQIANSPGSYSYLNSKIVTSPNKKEVENLKIFVGKVESPASRQK